jgi:SgrR family transcriptional regulator
MKLHSQFLRLHAHYGGTGAKTETTLDEIARVLDCTHRHALNVVTAMEGLGWIVWSPKRGRGSRSGLEFAVHAEQIAVEAVTAALSGRELEQAVRQIRAYVQTPQLEQALQSRLLGFFGHHRENGPNSQVDTLRLPLRQKLHTVDPLYMNLTAESFVASHVFDCLVRRNGRSGEIEPLAAHAWETDGSRTRWVFYLRKGIQFHNGQPLTSRDVVYSLRRLSGSGRPLLYSSIVKTLRRIEALGPLAVMMELAEPNELFLPFLCTSRASILPEELHGTEEDTFGLKPVGTGPFRVAELNGRHCILEAFPAYHLGRAQLDRAEIIHVPWTGGDPAGAEVEGSPFHLIHNPGAEAETGWSRMHSHASIRKFVTCNTGSDGPLQQPALRAAVMESIRGGKEDGDGDVNSNSDGAGTWELGGVKGTALLLPADRPLLIATIPQYREDGELVAARLLGRGLPSRLLLLEPEAFKGAARLQADLIIFSLIRDQDEELRLFDLYHTVSEHMEPPVKSRVQSLLSGVRHKADPVERAGYFLQLEELLEQEQLLQILYEKPLETAYLPSVRGLSFNSQGWIDLRQIWFPPEAPCP